MAITSSFAEGIVIKTRTVPCRGTTIQREGTFNPDTFVGWAEQDQAGQSYRCDHAFARYQIPADAKNMPLVFVHGYGGDGVCWETTPDDRPGFATLLLAEGYPTYVLDLPAADTPPAQAPLLQSSR